MDTSVVSHPCVVNVEADVDAGAVRTDFIQETRVVITGAKGLLIYQLSTRGLIPDASSICLTVERRFETPHEGNTVEPSLSARRRANVDFPPFREHSLKVCAVDIKRAAATASEHRDGTR